MPLAIAAGVAFAALPVAAAQAVPAEPPAAKVIKERGTAMAAKDTDVTGSIGTGAATDTSSCERSRKRLFVEGEGWIVRKVTTCY